MTPARDSLPLPPPDPPGRLPPLVSERLTDAWRLHWEPDVRRPGRGRGRAGRFRFDAPDGAYPVTYVNADVYGCFAEVYGDEGGIGQGELARRLSRVSALRALRLIPLDDGTALAALGLDLRISAHVDYAATMRWSAALRRWYPQADGIRYVGRRAVTKRNYCLFLDRCGRSLTQEQHGRLTALRPLVLRACVLYDLAPRLYDRRPSGGWP